jgi:hypothetical protein
LVGVEEAVVVRVHRALAAEAVPLQEPMVVMAEAPRVPMVGVVGAPVAAAVLDLLLLCKELAGQGVPG